MAAKYKRFSKAMAIQHFRREYGGALAMHYGIAINLINIFPMGLAAGMIGL
jgi:hypothetical protein